MSKFLNNNSLDILIKCLAYGSVSEMAKREGRNLNTLRKKQSEALFCIARATDSELINLETHYILNRMGQNAGLSYNKYCLYIENYIKAGINVPIIKSFWDILPCTGAFPTAFELFSCLIKTYWDKIAHRIKYLTAGLPKTMMNSCIVDFPVEYQHKNCFVYQVRLYSFHDDLIKIINCPDQEFAEESFKQYFSGKQKDYSRCVMRYILPKSDKWYVYLMGENNDILPYFRNKPVEWRVTYYDFEDTIIKSYRKREVITKSFARSETQKLNALYAIISYRENKEFVVDACIINNYCKYKTPGKPTCQTFEKDRRKLKYFYSFMLRKQEV